MIAAGLDPIAVSMLEVVLTHGYGGEVPTAGYPDTGTWLVFGIILMPVYVMIGAWFAGTPGDTRSAVMGVGYLLSITIVLWLTMFVGMDIVGLLFF